MTARIGFVPGEQERDRLVQAIQAAIDVLHREQFHAWMRGPFRALLPHEIVVCMELGSQRDAQRVDCLHHNLVDLAMIDFICNREHGLAVRLARSLGGRAQVSRTLDARALDALLDGGPRMPGQLHNAVVHRTRLLSGAAYFLVLVNVPPDQLERCQHLFKLLASHLKMALSRAIDAEQPGPERSLTQRELEILRWMGEAKSNREISIILGISTITLKQHVSKIYRKLNVQNRADAVAQGLRSDNDTE
jgi:DNA-binding CsgD family transcriptional regulator